MEWDIGTILLNWLFTATGALSRSFSLIAKNPDTGSLTLTGGAMSIVATRDFNHLIHGDSTIEPDWVAFKMISSGSGLEKAKV